MKEIILRSCQKYLPVRHKNDHKGSFGHVLIVGGDYGMAGAVRLVGEAALRTGAGLVSIATHPEHAYALVGNCPELMFHGIQNIHDLEELLEKATVVAIGPGLGRKAWGKSLLMRVLETTLPLVVDADGLNLLAKSPCKRDNWILTPHPGEAATLLQCFVSKIQSNRNEAILALQKQFGGIIVLKGAGTLVLGPNVEPEICKMGNPGMATAGMGDILTGVIAGLVAQKLSLHHAACLGVAVHAHAGDCAAKKSGQRGMIASDLLEFIRLGVNPDF